MIQEVLSEVISKNRELDELYKTTGDRFNIFQILNIKEVMVCRIITALIDPRGDHMVGELYLRLFMQEVLKLQIAKEEYEYVQVYKEYVIDGNRRIDIVIRTINRFIPIEVKLDAVDQEGQCAAYYKYQFEQNPKVISPVYYLTKDDHLPSGDGAIGLKKNSDGVGYEEIKVISFRNEILNWLKLCMKCDDTKKRESVKNTIQQFINFFERMIYGMDAYERLQVAEIINKSSDNMKAACSIAASTDLAKQMLMMKIFEKLEIGMSQLCDKYPIEKSRNTYFDYKKQVNEYYKHEKSSFPGLNYVIDRSKYESNVNLVGKELWLRIEIHDKLFFGFCLYSISQESEVENWGAWKDLLLEKIKGKSDGWWIDWSYLSGSENIDDAPDFNYHNDLFYRLFDKNYFDKFCEECISKIEERLVYLFSKIVL